jgi:ParB family chromosome partitioning protein
MTFTSIDIERLKVSPHNVRKSHNKTSFEELKASILAHGLMQNLVVTEADDGTYFVIAGARRLAALQALVKDGALARGEVPCQLVKDGGDAHEMSLAENTVREAMHPADEFEAFAALAKDHKPVDIARRFGVTERHVLQRLKLGRLAPEILKDYRTEKLNLDALMAYTLTDDHNAQRKVYKAQKCHHYPYAIKRLLTENKAEADGKLAKFVGLTAYEKAGGKITSDLFGEDKYLDDDALLQRLANEKLAAQAEKLKAEGWGWIDVAPESDYGFVSKCDEIEAKPIEAPKKLLDRHAKVQAECDKLEAEMDAAGDQDDDEAYEKLAAKSRKAQEQLEEVQEELDKYNAFDPEQMKIAGCYVTISHDGKISVRQGLVRPEDKKAMAKGEPLPAAEAKPREKGFSQSLIDSLKQYRLQIARAELASNPEIAFDLLAFKAACGAFTHSHIQSGPDVSFSHNHFRADMVRDAKDTVAGKALLGIQEKLNLTWLKEKSEQARFTAFSAISGTDKLAILAYCIAGTLKPQLAEKNALETALGFTEADVSQYWRPTADNYLSKITRDQLLAIGAELFGKQWAANGGGMKKGQLVNELHNIFAKPESTNCDAKTIAKINAWLPEGMAFTPPDKKPAKPKQKAA